MAEAPDVIHRDDAMEGHGRPWHGHGTPWKVTHRDDAVEGGQGALGGTTAGGAEADAPQGVSRAEQNASDLQGDVTATATTQPVVSADDVCDPMVQPSAPPPPIPAPSAPPPPPALQSRPKAPQRPRPRRPATSNAGGLAPPSSGPALAYSPDPPPGSRWSIAPDWSRWSATETELSSVRRSALGSGSGVSATEATRRGAAEAEGVLS